LGAAGLGRLSVFVVGALVAVACAAQHAHAAPTLHAQVTWRGECEDAAALRAEIQARGADLLEPESGAAALSLSVDVRRAAPEQLVASIDLAAEAWQEHRRVEARECEALRRAVAWVLAVLAQEREAASQRAPQPADGSFPELPVVSPPPPPPTTLKKPEAPSPLHSVAVPPAAPCAHPAPHYQLETELVVGVGLVDSVALGPALSVRYRPCGRFWPGFSLGAAHLVSLGYDLDARAVALQRTSAQLGAWLPVGVPSLRGGLVVEAGRIRAGTVASVAGPGGSGSAPWLAFVTPWRWSHALVGNRLSAQLGLDLAYTPLSYRLRYASDANPLARPSHFELRAGVGVAGHF